MKLHEVRQHHGVRLRVRRAAHAHDRLAHGVVHGEAGQPDRVARQQRRRARAPRGRAPRLGEALGDQLPRPAAPPSRRPGSRAACRAPRPRARARSSRSRPGRASAARPSAPESAITSAGRTSLNASTPAGIRWKGVISAPESVVGIAATRRPSAPPIALAASITRPPPSATSGRPSTPLPHGGRCFRHRPPAARRSTTSAPSTSAGASCARARVVSSA